MNAKKVFETCWAGFDHFLLAAVFVLLAAVWYSNDRPVSKPAPAASAPAVASPKPVSRAVEALRVSAGQRVHSIARSMVDSGWDRIPVSPAMDMREEGRAYEILFALPEGVNKDSVRVTKTGNVLTLAMKTDDARKVYMQRVRIPCSVDQPAAICSTVSNNVLCVRILPPAE